MSDEDAAVGGRPHAPLRVPPACDLTLELACSDRSTPGGTAWVMGAEERLANPVGPVVHRPALPQGLRAACGASS